MLAGKIAIVTGGTGALGGAVVQALLNAGATVWVPYVGTDDLDRLRKRITLPTDAILDGAPLDLTDEAAVYQAYGQVAGTYGGIDILVNIAGGFAGGEPVHRTPWSLWQQQLDINLKTAVISCAAAVPHMLTRGGAIVNVSSRTATQNARNVAAYGAAKRAVLQLTEALAAELRDSNITANAILPSVIDTPANRAADPNADHSRWVAPEAIARVILFLVGPDARIISGAAIPVYGRA
ncbi:SDR family oxidoreductase [Roseiflexus castenholzii]|jgi:NAD(P)-dependent dehydrogenase (short-subunit alcohol dehydrogenase family)|uniref:Short-chain dehydrogenase/reductase SDR n=1 Tax=Roseiflexus castenholzii (strain DSM 13941 / HLO8) TaxID=383372 RepID=A7NQS0_ROSCS|nr:SDR family oxidoreductase [Roseiflexus castenholzii]ABU59916.1 short-chain dehydrogenase/reductase SDR [Roseiflexus castenholzii DSM 13941]